jgi:hypothetical protein
MRIAFIYASGVRQSHTEKLRKRGPGPFLFHHEQSVVISLNKMGTVPNFKKAVWPLFYMSNVKTRSLFTFIKTKIGIQAFLP